MSAYTQKHRSGSSLLLSVVCASIIASAYGSGACINRFTHRDKGPEHVLTLLTGKLSYQDAQGLAAAIRDGKAAPVEWVSEDGKLVAKQFGELKIVRPMPVSCDTNSSGVVMVVTFATAQNPGKKLFVKFDPKTTIEFDEQAD